MLILRNRTCRYFHTECTGTVVFFKNLDSDTASHKRNVIEIGHGNVKSVSYNKLLDKYDDIYLIINKCVMWVLISYLTNKLTQEPFLYYFCEFVSHTHLFSFLTVSVISVCKQALFLLLRVRRQTVDFCFLDHGPIILRGAKFCGLSELNLMTQKNSFLSF